jgi:hypothetical protein
VYDIVVGAYTLGCEVIELVAWRAPVAWLAWAWAIVFLVAGTFGLRVLSRLGEREQGGAPA